LDSPISIIVHQVTTAKVVNLTSNHALQVPIHRHVVYRLNLDADLVNQVTIAMNKLLLYLICVAMVLIAQRDLRSQYPVTLGTTAQPNPNNKLLVPQVTIASAAKNTSTNV
jgi:hypothetical protein